MGFVLQVIPRRSKGESSRRRWEAWQTSEEKEKDLHGFWWWRGGKSRGTRGTRSNNIIYLEMCLAEPHKYPFRFCCLLLLNLYFFIVGENQIYQRQKRRKNCQTGYVLLLIRTETYVRLFKWSRMLSSSFFLLLISVTGPTNKKRAWSWPVYLEEEKAIAAPVKLFKEVLYL